MRQKLAFVLGLLVGAAALRLLARRRRPILAAPIDPRIEELRRTLVEQRQGSFESPAPPAPPAPAEPPQTSREADGELDLDSERRRIYEQGRAALEEMRRSGEPPPS